MAGKTVCLTGAEGFIGSWILKTLLDHGYTVRGTVRNLENSKHLLELPGASDRLKLFVADLMEPGCFDNVVEGCDGVIQFSSIMSPTARSSSSSPCKIFTGHLFSVVWIKLLILNFFLTWWLESKKLLNPRQNIGNIHLLDHLVRAKLTNIYCHIIQWPSN